MGGVSFIQIMARIQGRTFVGFGCKGKNGYPASGFFTQSEAWDEGGWRELVQTGPCREELQRGKRSI